MGKMTAFEKILDEQRRRVTCRRWSENYSDYLAEIADNFLCPLHSDILAAYGKGAGSEIPSEYDEILKRGYRFYKGKVVPAKMQAIHSSSALVCNAFGYWSDEVDRSPLQKALGCSSAIEKMKFEDVKNTGLGGIPPHLDVIFYAGTKVYAIESKFSEPYQEEKQKIEMGSKSYAPELWRQRGLRACADLVERINGHEMDGKLRYLGAPQLLKHILGLSNNHGGGYELIYLWYEMPGFRESDAHKKEVEYFSAIVGKEVAFNHLTYQDLFKRLTTNCDDTHREYLGKFSQRYL
jgi:restriction endonuclease-like protein